MTFRSAVAKLLIGLATASLLMTVAFLVVAPAKPFNYPAYGCGAPALWYFNGRPDPGRPVNPFQTGPRPGPQPPTCQDRIDARLRDAGIAGTITFAMFAGSVLIRGRNRRAGSPAARASALASA